MLLSAFYAVSAGAGLIGLALVDLRAVPPATGTCALILTVAALAAAVLH
ncbi:hypothetical protein ACH4JS_34895 [Streptomyces sp. NPDC017638]|nr:hypothetical protein [Streptomyces sp. SCL15-4]